MIEKKEAPSNLAVSEEANKPKQNKNTNWKHNKIHFILSRQNEKQLSG